jgi:hypothetical protein
MSDQEKFLARWSRRKLEPADEKVPAQPPQGADASPPNDDAAKPPTPARQAEAVAEFDLSKLPSLDSIGADSDIRAFLQAGVPSPLKNAALRRAWSADPAIRDYVGPNENFWEGAGPDGVPGFGELDPNLDVKKLAAEVFGDREPQTEPPAEATSSAPLPEKSDTAASAASESAATEPPHGATTDDKSLLQRDENAASQQGVSQEQVAVIKVRRHGGAMPH